MPLCETLGIHTEKLDADEMILWLDWAPGLCTSNEILHGGSVMALADSTGDTAAMVNLPEGAVGTSTIESKTNFLGAIRGGQDNCHIPSLTCWFVDNCHRNRNPE